MATWASSLDVLKDLDKLSQFSVGFKSPDIPIVSYSSYGRGNCIDKECTPPSSPLFNTDDQAFQSSSVSFSPTAGRGDRILALNQHRQKNSLQRQLRMAMGPGYSNELIEEYIRGETSSEQSSEAGQFDDDTEDTICEGASIYDSICDSSNSNSVNAKLMQNGASDEMVKPQSNTLGDMLTLETDTSSDLLIETDTSIELQQRDCSLNASLKTGTITEKSSPTNTSHAPASEINARKDSASPSSEVLSHQKKSRSSRNALLNSLANFKSSVKVMLPEETLDGKENIKSSMKVQYVNMSPEKTQDREVDYESTIKVQKKDICAENTRYGKANFKSSPMYLQDENVSPKKIQNGSFYYKSSVTSHDNNFKKKNKTSPSSQVTGNSLDTTPLYVRALDADFVLREEDFPPL